MKGAPKRNVMEEFFDTGFSTNDHCTPEEAVYSCAKIKMSPLQGCEKLTIGAPASSCLFVSLAWTGRTKI